MKIKFAKFKNLLKLLTILREAWSTDTYLHYRPKPLDGNLHRAEFRQIFKVLLLNRNSNDNHCILIAIDQFDKPMGYLLGSRKEGRQDHVATFRVFVLEACRKRGACTQLVESFEKWACNHKFHHIEIEVMLNNPALKTYKGMGYSFEAPLPKSAQKFNSLDDLYILSKQL